MLIVPHMDAAAKYLEAHGHHLVQVVWLRMVVQVMVVLPIAVSKHGVRGVVGVARPLLLLLRGVFLLGATACFFGALQYMPLADTVAITFVEPMLLLVFSALFLRVILLCPPPGCSTAHRR